MPMTEQQKKNLAKGHARSRAIGAENRKRRAAGQPTLRGDEIEVARAGQRAQADQDARMAEAVQSSDTVQVTKEMYLEAIQAALRLYKRYRAKGGDPPRILVEVSREARQLANDLEAVLERLGATAQADEFFAQLETRLASGTINLDPGGGAGAYPDVEAAS